MDHSRLPGVAGVAELTAGRDRVADAAKLAALLIVVVGHSLAWQVHDGRAVNVIELRPRLVWLTWVVQILPVFFAMGAMANQRSLSRAAGAGQFHSRRLQRLLGPVLVYATLWTILLGAVSIWSPDVAHDAGRFLAQLLWFIGVYVAVTAAVPLTLAWHRRAPRLSLGIGLAAIVGVDLLRVAGAAGPGWLNMLLVWGWLHQLGYSYPGLRRAPRALTASFGLTLIATAVLLASDGPYSRSLVTLAGDPELSNLAPPSVVLALHGAGLVLLLAAADSRLARILQRPRLWTAVATLGSQGMGIYLWHIPIVGLIAGAALARDWSAEPFSWRWWLAHSLTALVAIGGSFAISLLAGRAERHLPAARWSPRPAALVPCAAALLVLHLSVTGFATRWGPGALGVPGSSLVNLAALWLIWLARGRWNPPARTTQADR